MKKKAREDARGRSGRRRVHEDNSPKGKNM